MFLKLLNFELLDYSLFLQISVSLVAFPTHGTPLQVCKPLAPPIVHISVQDAS